MMAMPKFFVESLWTVIFRLTQLAHKIYFNTSTNCVTDLDQKNEMIIFESILTALEASGILRGSWISRENLA
jgi:hypothetical protein